MCQSWEFKIYFNISGHILSSEANGKASTASCPGVCLNYSLYLKQLICSVLPSFHSATHAAPGVIWGSPRCWQQLQNGFIVPTFPRASSWRQQLFMVTGKEAFIHAQGQLLAVASVFWGLWTKARFSPQLLQTSSRFSGVQSGTGVQISDSCWLLSLPSRRSHQSHGFNYHSLVICLLTVRSGCQEIQPVSS